MFWISRLYSLNILNVHRQMMKPNLYLVIILLYIESLVTSKSVIISLQVVGAGHRFIGG